MKFILVVLFVMTDGDVHKLDLKTYDALDKCMAAREIFVRMEGRPIINYQAICVIWDKK